MQHLKVIPYSLCYTPIQVLPWALSWPFRIILLFFSSWCFPQYHLLHFSRSWQRTGQFYRSRRPMFFCGSRYPVQFYDISATTSGAPAVCLSDTLQISINIDASLPATLFFELSVFQQNRCGYHHRVYQSYQPHTYSFSMGCGCGTGFCAHSKKKTASVNDRVVDRLSIFGSAQTSVQYHTESL